MNIFQASKGWRKRRETDGRRISADSRFFGPGIQTNDVDEWAVSDRSALAKRSAS
jgi:hypothetical protein